MSLRWKLNLSVIAFVSVTLVAGAVSLRSMARHAEQTRAFLRSRESSQFTADVRTQLYQRFAVAPADSEGDAERQDGPWPEFLLADIDVQVRLAQAETERAHWEEVRESVGRLGGLNATTASDAGLLEALRRAERGLRALRHYYSVTEFEAMASSARLGLIGQVATGIACGLAVVLFLIHLMMIHRWLVKPVEVLKASADALGRGDLEYRVPLEGNHELAQLARRIDAMAKSLSAHQAALVEARELSAIGELCAHVAHGLRNPLAAIRAGAQLAERRSSGSAEAQSMLRDLAHQADRMDNRITRLFQFSKPRELRPAPASFMEIARAAQAQALPLLQSRGVELVIEDACPNATWRLDGEQIVEALAELVTNAAHHSPAGARVRLRGEALPPENGSGPRLRIQVIDSGSGMPAATAEKAFDLFFTSRPEGTGMGLALVRRIIERHDGSIRLDSAPGAGTSVTVVLPAIRAFSKRL